MAMLGGIQQRLNARRWLGRPAINPLAPQPAAPVAPGVTPPSTEGYARATGPLLNTTLAPTASTTQAPGVPKAGPWPARSPRKRGAGGAIGRPITPTPITPTGPTPVLPPGPGRPAGEDDGFLTDFGPDDDLRYTQINPQASRRLVGIGQQSDRARRALFESPEENWEGIGAGDDREADVADTEARRFGTSGGPGPFRAVAAPSSFAPGAEAQRARQLTAQGLESLAGTPSRQELAEQSLQNFIRSTEPEYQRRQQDVGRQAAALGRVGSGMTGDDVQRLGRSREAEIVQQARELATETAGQELGDREARLRAASGVAGQFRGEDIGEAGFTQGLRGEARGERGEETDYGFRGADLGLRRGQYLSDLGERGFEREAGLREEARGERGQRLGYQQQRFGNRRALAGDLGQEEDVQFGRESARRGELRGERGYQAETAQRAQQNRINQRMLEEDLLDRSFGRAATRAQIGRGYATDYAEEGERDQGAAADALEQAALSRSLGGTAPAAGGGGTWSGRELTDPSRPGEVFIPNDPSDPTGPGRWVRR